MLKVKQYIVMLKATTQSTIKGIRVNNTIDKIIKKFKMPKIKQEQEIIVIKNSK